MKTEYSQEIKNLIESTFTPSTPDDASASKKTLNEIYESVIGVLPSKWIYEEDVYDVLQQLNYRPFPFQDEFGVLRYYYYLISVQTV